MNLGTAAPVSDRWASFAPAARLSDRSRLSGSFSGVDLLIPVTVTASASQYLADKLIVKTPIQLAPAAPKKENAAGISTRPSLSSSPVTPIKSVGFCINKVAKRCREAHLLSNERKGLPEVFARNWPAVRLGIRLAAEQLSLTPVKRAKGSHRRDCWVG